MKENNGECGCTRLCNNIQSKYNQLLRWHYYPAFKWGFWIIGSLALSFWYGWQDPDVKEILKVATPIVVGFIGYIVATCQHRASKWREKQMEIFNEIASIGWIRNKRNPKYSEKQHIFLQLPMYFKTKDTGNVEELIKAMMVEMDMSLEKFEEYRFVMKQVNIRLKIKEWEEMYFKWLRLWALTQDIEGMEKMPNGTPTPKKDMDVIIQRSNEMMEEIRIYVLLGELIDVLKEKISWVTVNTFLLPKSTKEEILKVIGNLFKELGNNLIEIAKELNIAIEKLNEKETSREVVYLTQKIDHRLIRLLENFNKRTPNDHHPHHGQ